MPDLNVWLALSWANHMHSDAAWIWFSWQEDNRFFFCRFTQLGLLRLLATSVVMGKDVRTIGEGWKVYDRWLEDSRVSIRQEVFELDAAFRAATRSVSRLSSPKALGDGYLRAVSQVTPSVSQRVSFGTSSRASKRNSPATIISDMRHVARYGTG